MKTKKFLIQIESADTTRWLFPDSHFADLMRTLAMSAVVAHTDGPKPSVIVSPEEQPEAVPVHVR